MFDRVADLDLYQQRRRRIRAIALVALNALPPALRMLHLCDADLSDAAIGLLAEVPALSALAELWLLGNRLSAEDCASALLYFEPLAGVVLYLDPDADFGDPALALRVAEHNRAASVARAAR